MKIVHHKLKQRENSSSKKKIVLAIFLNLLIVVLQIVFGLLSNSISLLTDAAHNLQDVISLIIALIAILIVNRLPTMEMTFGFLRSEALAGFVNSIFLKIMIFAIMIFAIKRLLVPEEVEGLYVIIFGFLGFIINFLSAKSLVHHNDIHHEDLNIKTAYLHLLSDAGVSLGVFIGGILVYLYNIYWVDPLLAIIFSAYILKENLKYLRKSYKILMEAVPEQLNLKEMLDQIHHDFKQIKEIHDIHIWSLSSKDVYLSAHIVLEKSCIDYTNILKKLEDFFKKYGINHITIQLETEDFKCEVLH